MAFAQNGNDFDVWLKEKLIDLNTDDEVFSPYIKGILDSDDSIEEKREGLEGILTEIIEKDIENLCNEILSKWEEYLKINIKEEKDINHVGIDEKLAKLMEGSKLKAPEVTVKLNSEQQKLKEAILANYAEVSDGETSDSEDNVVVSKNSNAELVAKAEREKRDKDKEESQKKKEKDKEDRAKQKNKDEDRKEKEKKRTQKGEKRR